MTGPDRDRSDAQMTPEQRWALQSMGVTVWQSRGQSRGQSEGSPADAPEIAAMPAAPAAAQPVERRADPEPQPVAVPDPVAPDAPVDISALDWDALKDEVSRCTRCALHQGRTQSVFGVGAEDANWMIIGEAPGAEEDRRGEPFVGRAGKLLDAMLQSVELDRSRVFIANILKSRPPDNRDPHVDEIAACAPFLQRQIELVRPSLILAVGGVAAKHLLATDDAVGRLRGKVHAYGRDAIPLVVTYHPAYLLRQPSAKGKVWQDLKLARRTAAAGLK
jgi:DNA polymerase